MITDFTSNSWNVLSSACILSCNSKNCFWISFEGITLTVRHLLHVFAPRFISIENLKRYKKISLTCEKWCRKYINISTWYCNDTNALLLRRMKSVAFYIFGALFGMMLIGYLPLIHHFIYSSYQSHQCTLINQTEVDRYQMVTIQVI